MKKRILLIICFVVTFVLSFFAGFLISKLDLFKEKEPEVNNILNGNTFYLNEEGKSYINLHLMKIMNIDLIVKTIIINK